MGALGLDRLACRVRPEVQDAKGATSPQRHLKYCGKLIDNVSHSAQRLGFRYRCLPVHRFQHHAFGRDRRLSSRPPSGAPLRLPALTTAASGLQALFT